MYEGESAMIGSRLKLSFKELKELYVPYLLLKEIIQSDVSRLIISTGFSYVKENAFDVYEANKDKKDHSLMNNAYPLLVRIASRFIDASVSFRIGWSCKDFDGTHQPLCKWADYYFLNAQYLFNKELNEETLSPQELYYKATLYMWRLSNPFSTRDTYRLLVLASSKGSEEASLGLKREYKWLVKHYANSTHV